MSSAALVLNLWGVACLLAAAGCSSCVGGARSGGDQPEPRLTSPRRTSPDTTRPEPARVRPAAMAGSWYPDDAKQLVPLLDRYFAEARPLAKPDRVMALISPHAGYAFSGKAAAAGYGLLRGQAVTRVVVLGPSHHVPFHGASIADVTHYETPLGRIPLDRVAVARLRQSPLVHNVEQAHQREHSLEIQLPLLQQVLKRFTLVPIVIGRLEASDYGKLADALAQIVDVGTVVVASSDFTHRGPNYSYELPDGPGTIKQRLDRLDQGSIDQILRLDSKGLLAHAHRTGSTICGLAPVSLLLELIARQKGPPKPFLISHYTSGDVTGDWTNTVTYVDVAFSGSWPERREERADLHTARNAGEQVFPLSRGEKQQLLKLARSSLEASVRKGSFDGDPLRAGSYPDSLRRKAGAFVTLKCKLGPRGICSGRGDDLRGCIGTIAPVDPLVDTVARRAASAALEDSRFPSQVGTGELGLIRIEVSVLTPPRPVDGPDRIVIGRHGIILRRGFNSATFLPQVAPEQGWDLQTTLTHLSRKAGLGPDGWRDGASFSVYEAIVFAERET